MTSAEKLAQKRKLLEQQSEKIKALADNEAQSSLKCIHLLSVAGGATSETYTAIERRIIEDQDTHGAYHLALMAQSTSDLPVDARQLIELVVTKGNNTQLLSLLKNLPVPPVEMIKQKVVESGDAASIAEMVAYLNANPEGIGSHSILGSGQKERIVPLSEG
ncbi:hypothetical protein [Psychrobacter sanguinis]|uniref:hypothetical protein n=1 Tax=Psychrobacter sanguinis TaxID=861445 RepID=UPI0019191435|nr:hypothetical protein [Psychrobacter sanguinis]MCC3308001.1 hypothetical protein [Psychrobacter sanguinis]MCC3344233.1 hypothetical protein [Psychrobacter sanguinis]MDY3306236.1 hypothetical protein [Psychrobacter sanguinis]UEC25291.1 hypothetical protein LK453_12320 [Psychrobacter sanguinis]